PATGVPLAPGGEGELVFTSLTKEALPILRYRTGDLSALAREPCRCGRTLARMARIKGRTDDMLVIRGVNVYPSHIQPVLPRLPLPARGGPRGRPRGAGGRGGGGGGAGPPVGRREPRAARGGGAAHPGSRAAPGQPGDRDRGAGDGAEDRGAQRGQGGAGRREE